LGIVLYEMLTGRAPFRSDSEYELMRMQVEAAPPSPREFAPGLADNFERVVLRALSKEPESRFKTAEEFLAALTTACDIADGETTDRAPMITAARAPSRDYQSGGRSDDKFARLTPWLGAALNRGASKRYAAAAALIAVAAALAGVSVWRNKHSIEAVSAPRPSPSVSTDTFAPTPAPPLASPASKEPGRLLIPPTENARTAEGGLTTGAGARARNRGRPQPEIHNGAAPIPIPTVTATPPSSSQASATKSTVKQPESSPAGAQPEKKPQHVGGPFIKPESGKSKPFGYPFRTTDEEKNREKKPGKP
ncbi:MAG: hypothetical protein ACREAB_12210, partial [Blastocatellia bacterium]